jgi:MSHA biogenesis protein MshP
MCRDRQSGFGIATAIFLLLVLGSLTAYLVTLTGTREKASVLDLQGAQAYQAARAGVEWGAYQLLRDSAGAFATACDGASYAAPIRQNLSGLAGSLGSFTASVECGSASFTETANTFRVYQLRVTACNMPAAGACPGAVGPTYVERQLQVVISR